MKITNVRVSHLTAPLGWDLGKPTVTWTVEEARGKKQINASVTVYKGSEVVFESTGKELSNIGVVCDFPLEPRTMYRVNVTVEDETGDRAQAETVFETGKMQEEWQAEWITAPFEKNEHPVIFKTIDLAEKPAKGRIYVVGLGVYELYVNGTKVSDEVLAPLCNDYANWLQSQTYDITDMLCSGSNKIECMLGKGWYMGRLGFGAGGSELFGDRMQLLLEGHVASADGTEISFGTKAGEWYCTHSVVLDDGIYDGEIIDANTEPGVPVAAVGAQAPKALVVDRLSPPVRVIEKLTDAKLLTTPKGERVLDFGQVLTGWLEFRCDAPKGTKIYLQFGEIMQDDCFYRDNLRSAREELTYISDGTKTVVRPHFTFYGFRYVKVEGMDAIDPKAFTACVIHSDLQKTGFISTSNPKLNKLVENAYWGQRGNFLDVPTDCPQRDERMGWTGDAQVFAPTASYNMYTPAFYRKYMHDMLLEQKALDGAVPHVVPDIIGTLARANGEENKQYASCAWADVAAVVPWTVYKFYGDKTLLKEQYDNMTLWAEWIHSQDAGDHLWKTGFHFADWLAFDNPDKSSPLGGTDCYYIASVYYFYSTDLCRKAAAVLGYTEDERKYAQRADSIREAIRLEYFTPTGRIAVPTQTAMLLALYFDLVPEQFRDRLIGDLRQKLIDNRIYLQTGFVGTYFLMTTLTKVGLHDFAVQLLLNEEMPSWFYEINMGATTVWERWNSVLPDGHVSDTGMNSMNHYAFGSVMEWVYGYLCGLRPVEDVPGFKKAIIAPQTDPRLDCMQCEYLSAAGKYRASWERADGRIVYRIEVPFDASAEFVPENLEAELSVNGVKTKGVQALEAGSYEIICSDKDVRTDYYKRVEVQY